MTHWRCRTLMVVAALAATPTQAASSFEAGQWRHQTKMVSAEVPGVPESLVKLVAGNRARTTCNSTPELQAHPEALMTADPKAVCKLRQLSMSNGKLVFDTFCTNERFPDGLRVLSRGTYTSRSYEISTMSTGKRDGKPVKILTTSSGKRVADGCAKP